MWNGAGFRKTLFTVFPLPPSFSSFSTLALPKLHSSALSFPPSCVQACDPSLTVSRHLCAAGLHPPNHKHYNKPFLPCSISTYVFYLCSEIASCWLMLRKGGHYCKCSGAFDLNSSRKKCWFHIDVQHDTPSMLQNVSGVSKSQACSFVSSVCKWPHFRFCLYQNQLMSPHSLRIASMLHCCQRAHYKTAHSDPFVRGQNSGEPGTTARHFRCVLVQWGIKCAQWALYLRI